MSNYLRQGSEDVFIEDNAEIEYAKMNNLRKSITGYMLGDYDEHGVYTVDEEIVKELIGLKKYIVDIIDNMVVCHSVIRLNKAISFLVSFDEDCATLSLLEKVNHQGNFKENAGSFCDINEYVLDKIETSGVVNRNYVYSRWNISEEEEPALNIHDLDEESLKDLFGITNRFKYLLYCNTVLLEREEEIEAEQLNYSEQIMKLLESYPELKKKVDEAVKQTLDEKQDFICLDKPFVVSEINEVIEQAIENNMDVLSEQDQEEFKAEKHIIQNNHNLRVSEIIPIIVEKPINANAENTVGRIVMDTMLAVSKTIVEQVVNKSDNQVEGEEKSENTKKTAPIKVEKLSIKELQQAKDNERKDVEEQTKNAYVGYRLGVKPTAERLQPKEKKRLENIERLKKIVGVTAIISNASKKAKEKVATETKKKAQTANTNSLVGKAVNNKTATAKKGAEIKKSASNNKATGTNKKPQAKKPATKKAATDGKGKAPDNKTPTTQTKGNSMPWKVARTTKKDNVQPTEKAADTETKKKDFKAADTNEVSVNRINLDAIRERRERREEKIRPQETSDVAVKVQGIKGTNINPRSREEEDITRLPTNEEVSHLI